MTAPSIAQAHKEIAERLLTAWIGAGYAKNRLQLPLRPFTMPASGVWAHLQIKPVGSRQGSLNGGSGGRLWRANGFLQIDTYSPLENGDVARLTLAEVAVLAYEGKSTPSEVWFQEVGITSDRAGAGDYAAWHITTIMANFRYNRRH